MGSCLPVKLPLLAPWQCLDLKELVKKAATEKDSEDLRALRGDAPSVVSACATRVQPCAAGHGPRQPCAPSPVPSPLPQVCSSPLRRAIVTGAVGLWPRLARDKNEQVLG